MGQNLCGHGLDGSVVDGPIVNGAMARSSMVRSLHFHLNPAQQVGSLVIQLEASHADAVTDDVM